MHALSQRQAASRSTRIQTAVVVFRGQRIDVATLAWVITNTDGLTTSNFLIKMVLYDVIVHHLGSLNCPRTFRQL